MSDVPSTAKEIYQRRRIALLAILVLVASPIAGVALFHPSQRDTNPVAILHATAASSTTVAPTTVAATTVASTNGSIPGNPAGSPTNPQVAVQHAPVTEFDYIWDSPSLPTNIPPDLQARLSSEIAQMVKAGHLAPLPLIGGIGFTSGSYPWDLGGAKYQPYTLAWLNPADTITALSQAYPLLPTDQQAALRSYLRAELDSYPIDAFEIGGAYTAAKPTEGSPYYRGARRERFPLPADETYNLWPPLRPPIDNLYGLWASGNATGDWAYVQTRWSTIASLFAAFAARGTPDSYGQIGGLIGFARIARQLGHEPEAQAAADLAARGLIAGANFKAFATTADSRRPNSHATSYAVFSYLTPEVGAYLRDHSRAAVAAYLDDATATANSPTWYLAWGEQTLGGENAFLSPDVAWQIFLAKAYATNETETALRRYLDQPWSVGDPYFIQKLVATIRAGVPRDVAAGEIVKKGRQIETFTQSPSLRMSAFTDNRSTFPNGQPPVAERYEATFHIEGGSWTNPMIPYAADAAPGVRGETGISVDALISNDGWKTILTQPGFLYQAYAREQGPAGELLVPQGGPVWKVRVAFPAAGAWQMRLTARDASGSVQYPADGTIAITTAARTGHGFIHVSSADPRYFVYDDGTTFNPAGYNEGFDRKRVTYDLDAKLEQWRGGGPNFLRLWMSSSGLVGSSWLPWRSMTLPYDGYLPATGLVADHPDGDTPFVFKMDAANRCMVYGASDSAALAIRPGHTYRLTVRARTEGVAAGTGGGFTVLLAESANAACGAGTPAKPLLSPLTGTGDWQTLTTTFTLPAATVTPYLTLALANASGVAYVSAVSLRDVADDAASTDLITRSPANLLGGFDLAAAWQWDYVLDGLQAQGIAAKIVLLEKNDWVFNHLGRDGTPTATAPGGNTNFYAAPDTAVRAYQQYYWRGVLARWGGYRAVHSWELLNEGDPDSPDHAALAGDFARFMHANDIARHPVTTSVWAGFPLGLIRSAGLDYADIHLYEDTQTPRPLWRLPAPATLDTTAAETQNGHGNSIRLPAGVRGDGEKASVAVHGKGTWTIRVDIRADDLVGICPYGESPDRAGPQLLWLLDGGTYAGSENRGTGIVPPAPTGQPFVCSSPAGTYDWRTVTGGFTLDDDTPHSLFIAFRTQFATRGTAWFDNIAITAPDGRTLPLFGDGTFDDQTSPSLDLALGTVALGDRHGAFSPAGAGMPLVRGETGLARGQSAMEEPDLLRDKDGFWLRALLWSQIASGGAINVPWYTASINANRLWSLFAPYAAFLADIPLATGGYIDAQATATNTAIRVIGQKNPTTNRAHLWLRTADATWKQASSGSVPTAIEGSVRLRLAPGRYHAEWWDTTSGDIIRVDTISAPDGQLVVALPLPLRTDVAVRISPA